MPRLPSAEELGRRPIPSSQRRIDAPDSMAVPRALSRAGAVIGELGEQYQREQDANAVFEARRQLDDWERSTIFDPEKGAIRRQGKDAEGLPDELAQNFDEFTTKLSEGLSSERQRQVFREMATSRRAQVLDWGAKHATREREVYEQGQFKADLDSMAERAARFPDRAAGEIAIGRQRIIGFMRSKGRSTEEIDRALLENDSRIHSTVLESMLTAGEGEKAAEYLKANRSGMTEKALVAAEKGVKELTIRTLAQTFADDAIARGLKPEDALREAREKYSGTDEEAVVREVKTRFTEQQAIRAQQEKETSDEAWKVITNGGGRKDIKPDLWNRLSGQDQRQINDYVEQRWRRAKADAEGKDTDDVETYYGLRRMAAEEPARFAAIDLMRVQPLVSKQNFARLIEIQAGINKNDAKVQELGQVTGRALRLVDQDLRAAGIDMTAKEGTAKAKQAAAFKSQLVNALDVAALEGRVDDRKAREIALGLLREGVEQGSGVFGMFQTKKRAFEMEPGKTYVSKTYDDIPAEIRQQLEAELPQERGIYGNSAARRAQVERMYQRGIELGRFQP